MSKPQEKTEIKTERVSFHLSPDIIQALQKLAAKNGTDLSKEIRHAIDAYLDVEVTAENINMINGVIQQELETQIKALGNRLVAMLNRLTIISAAGYYSSIAIIASIIDTFSFTPLWILTFVMCYELIHLIIEKNNLAEFDTFNIFKWIFKTFVAVFILTNTFNIVMGIFDIGQHVVNQSAGLISGSLELGNGSMMAAIQASLEAMGVGELIGLFFEVQIVRLCMMIMSIVIMIIVWGRMLEIYLTVSVAPIPFSTMANREWGQIGNNYLKSLFALAFQGFLIMICVAIYAVLIAGIAVSDNMHTTIWTIAGYTALLCFILLKTGSISKSIFNSH